MSSVDCLREFVNERLTAAAEEIFGVFKRTIVEYEEEIDRQRKLLDIVFNPEIKLHRLELEQQPVYKEEVEVPPDQQLCNQDWNSILDLEDPEDPEPRQIKEEQEEHYTSQEGEQPEFKQKTDTSGSTSTYEESEPELLSDEWLLSHNPYVAENRDEKDEEHESVRGLERNSQPEASNQLHQNNHSYNWCTSTSQTHLSIQADERPHLCKVCGKDFTCNSKLKLHMRTHTGERPYLCTTCNRRFCDIGGLKRHLRIHTGEKPYPCEICGKDFRHDNVLKVHMRIHTGERPYICNTCGKTFCVLSALKRHSRIHSGEKLFTCKTCGRAFQQSGALNIHIRTHTGERPYLCKTCGKDFKQASTLLVHMKTHTS